MIPDILYAAEPGLVLGFHGCEEAVRDAVVSGQSMLRESRNPYDWLGYGIYFWQNNYERAWEFAQYPPGKPKLTRPSVLGAVLDLGNCLDLVDKKHLEMVKVAFTYRSSKENEREAPSQKNKPAANSSDLLLRYLDCSVMEDLHTMQNDFQQTPYDSVRGVFVEGKPVYEGAGIYDKTHVQICIRNPNCVRGYFCPRERIRWP